MTEPIDVFISYTNKDRGSLEDLETHLAPLKRQGYVREWHDRQVLAGTDRLREVDEHLERAQVILLLVSPDFLASAHHQDVEIARALERHAAKEARVIPILLRPCDWKTEVFAKLQALPRDERPIATWKDRDEAWAQVTKELRRVMEDMLGGPPARPAPPPRPAPAAKSAVVEGAPAGRRPTADQVARRLTRASVRRLLGEVLRSDSAFDGFCLDYFETVHRLFSDGMDRTRKENILFKEAATSDVLAKLRTHAPKAVAEREHLIEHEDAPNP